MTTPTTIKYDETHSLVIDPAIWIVSLALCQHNNIKRIVKTVTHS